MHGQQNIKKTHVSVHVSFRHNSFYYKVHWALAITGSLLLNNDFKQTYDVILGDK